MSSSKMKWLWGNWVIFPVLLIITLIPRLYLLLHSNSYSSDGVSYLSTALWLRNPELVGEVPKRIYFILYPSLVLIFNSFIHDIALSGRVINFIIGLSLPPAAFLIGNRIFGRGAGLVGWLFCAVNPILVMQSAEIRGDNLFALMTLVAIFLFEKIDWRNSRLKDSILFGLILGICQLSRTNGVMYLFVIIPIWLWWIRKGAISFKPWFWRTLIPFLVVFAIISSIPHILLAARGEQRPSMLFYTYLDGNIAAFGDRESAFFKLNADATEYQFLEDVSNADLRTVIESLPQLPRKFARNFAYCFMLLFGPAIDIILKMSIVLLPLLFYIFYYWGEVRIPDGSGRTIFWSWPSFLILPLINVEDLYFLPLIPVLMLILAWLLTVASSLGWISRWRGFVLVILVLIMFVPLTSKTVTDIKTEASYVNPYVNAGNWIRENTSPDSLIMARNPEVFFHSLRRGYRMPLEDLNRTLIFANNRKVKYIIFGPSEIKKRHELYVEAYKEIYNKGKQSRLKVVHTVDTGRDLVFILEIVPENFKVKALPRIG